EGGGQTPQAARRRDLRGGCRHEGRRPLPSGSASSVPSDVGSCDPIAWRAIRTDVHTIRARLWEDLNRLRSPEGYLRAGAPRYSTLFGRDALISAWQTLSLDPSIAAATLRVLASYQGSRVNPKSEEEPGKILHEHRFDAASRSELPQWDFPYYGSVDSTPLFLIVASEYLRETKDLRLAKDLWPSVAAAYRWMEVYGDLDGDDFVEYERKNPNGLF